MKEIIEDTVTRNKEFKAERQRRVERLKEMKAPAKIIEVEEMIAKMTLAEYKIYCDEIDKQEKQIKQEYAKTHQIQQHIVEQIYAKETTLEYDYLVYSSNAQFLMRLHPLTFMSQEDFDNDLYQVFIDHARELYGKRYAAQYQKDLDQRDSTASSRNE